MTKPRRRQAGEGGISEYATKAGPRYLIKYTVQREDGIVSRRAAARVPDAQGGGRGAGRHQLRNPHAARMWCRRSHHGRVARSVARRPAAGAVDHSDVTARTSACTSSRARVGAACRSSPAPESRALYRDARGPGPTRPQGRRWALRPDGPLRRTPSSRPRCARRSTQGLLAVNPADKRGRRPPERPRAPEIHPWTGPQLAAFLGWAVEQRLPRRRRVAGAGVHRACAAASCWRCAGGIWTSTPAAWRPALRRARAETRGEGARIVEGPTKTGRERVVDLDPRPSRCCGGAAWAARAGAAARPR